MPDDVIIEALPVVHCADATSVTGSAFSGYASRVDLELEAEERKRLGSHMNPYVIDDSLIHSERYSWEPPDAPTHYVLDEDAVKAIIGKLVADGALASFEGLPVMNLFHVRTVSGWWPGHLRRDVGLADSIEYKLYELKGEFSRTWRRIDHVLRWLGREPPTRTLPCRVSGEDKYMSWRDTVSNIIAMYVVLRDQLPGLRAELDAAYADVLATGRQDKATASGALTYYVDDSAFVFKIDGDDIDDLLVGRQGHRIELTLVDHGPVPIQLEEG